ncbi:MAG: ammonia-forming cytochrome c nitrite reductase subunit c552 [Chloroflexi bacterium]|nr:ammonia-forming cytochrome c nitrite reductase subunit c552 [Chloroflexota bacterium]
MAVARLGLLAASLGVAGILGVSGALAQETPTAPAATPAATEPVAPGPSSTVVPVGPDASGTPDTNTCRTCHTAIDNAQHEITEAWAASVHGQNGIGCADCHGGDPTSDQVTIAMSPAKGFRGSPGRTESVATCGTCHSDVDRMRQYQIPTDQYAKYQASVHGERLISAGDTRVAICTDCHGSHDVKKASAPTAKVYPLNVPQLCASCHADADLMEPYGIPTNQLAIYAESVHGKALLSESDLRAPTCASCHGSHDAQPPSSAEVVGVCGKCHTATQALYEQSRHAELEIGPKCWTCHGTHDVALPDESRFFHPKPPSIDCTICHDPVDRGLVLSADRFTNDADRRCDTCHHPDSLLYAQAEGIHGALDRAATAYDAAAARIREAAGVGMIVSDAEVELAGAKTDLIRARAAVHTTKLTDVASLADEAETKAGAARGLADEKLAASFFRRAAMVVVLALILVNVFALVLIRRRLDHSYAVNPPPGEILARGPDGP